MEEKANENPYKKYCSEINRFESFKNYKPTNWIFTEQIKQDYARAGFYWTGVDEEVKCNFCHFKLFRLHPDEKDPIKLHCRFNSTCPFICHRRTDNIPIDEEKLKTFLPPPPTFVAGTPRPKWPEYSSIESRLHSFRRWPSDHCISVNDLVSAGFFYLGYSDVVGCYFCGLGLKDFEKGEIPLETHKKFRSDCLFVKNRARVSEPVLPGQKGFTSNKYCYTCFAVAVGIALLFKFRPNILQYMTIYKKIK